MKVSEFVRQVKKQGVKFESHGSRHDWYINPANGLRSQIPRHGSKDLCNGTRDRILKDLGL
ncbi:MAG: type II toxin-antitoxin system HicA family toxin [Oscillospiraceae bacterium]|nr:type II toxin-antitoxin system HicA family toxin [Oscillospiraceae bacterium]